MRSSMLGFSFSLNFSSRSLKSAKILTSMVIGSDTNCYGPVTPKKEKVATISKTLREGGRGTAGFSITVEGEEGSSGVAGDGARVPATEKEVGEGSRVWADSRGLAAGGPTSGLGGGGALGAGGVWAGPQNAWADPRGLTAGGPVWGTGEVVGGHFWGPAGLQAAGTGAGEARPGGDGWVGTFGGRRDDSGVEIWPKLVGQGRGPGTTAGGWPGEQQGVARVKGGWQDGEDGFFQGWEPYPGPDPTRPGPTRPDPTQPDPPDPNRPA